MDRCAQALSFNSQFHTRWIQVFIRSTLICITRAQAPCTLGDEVVLKSYEGSQFRKTKQSTGPAGACGPRCAPSATLARARAARSRSWVFGRVSLCASDELLRWGVAQDIGYVLHSVPRHHSRFPSSSRIAEKVSGPRLA
jgi:hypothetical protein